MGTRSGRWTVASRTRSAAPTEAMTLSSCPSPPRLLPSTHHPPSCPSPPQYFWGVGARYLTWSFSGTPSAEEQSLQFPSSVGMTMSSPFRANMLRFSSRHPQLFRTAPRRREKLLLTRYLWHQGQRGLGPCRNLDCPRLFQVTPALPCFCFVPQMAFASGTLSVPCGARWSRQTVSILN
uniref:Uncharacterized protein n=1 Tax=Myotis myotis TaxID=51298 RepID=A0A7J7SR22_MYOMY|nr:hypothetical protein mMyoMyo1_009293 [Myotis myotis]